MGSDIWDFVPIAGPIRRSILNVWDALTGQDDSSEKSEGDKGNQEQKETSTQDQGQKDTLTANPDVTLVTTPDTRQSSSGASSPVSSITSTSTVSPVVTTETSNQVEQAQTVQVESQAQASYDVQNQRSLGGSQVTVAPVLAVEVPDVNYTSSDAQQSSPTLAETLAPVAVAACLGYFGMRAVSALRRNEDAE